MSSIQSPRREVDVLVLERGRDLVDPHPPRGKRAGIELDADGEFLRSEDRHLRHPADRGDPLRHHGLAVLVQDGERKRRRGEGDVEDRLIGRVDLLIGGRAGHVPGQLRGDLGDGGLNVLGGGVQVAAQAELKGDLCESEEVGRAHRVEPGDRRELPLERGRDGRRHRLGTRTGEAGGDLYGREIDVGQVGNRQEPVAHRPEHQDAQHDEGRHDRADEQLGEVHVEAVLISTFAPGTRRS